MVKGNIIGMILLAAIAGALINDTLDGSQSLSVVLWAVSGVTILVILAQAYNIGIELDKFGDVGGSQAHDSYAYPASFDSIDLFSGRVHRGDGWRI